MCGLIFLHNPASAEAELGQRAAQALERIGHRGPDDQGIARVAPAIMGHCRLSIIDLSASRQPMWDFSGRYVLAYNGETYNFRELRTRLEGHWTFRTQGDTEVVLAGLITYGARFLQEMEGMWALSLWDTAERRLVLARDRMGKKPLYYQLIPEGIACASELRALAALSSSPLEEDLDSTADYLRYGYYLPGTTAYQGVCEVLPGHTLSWSPAGAMESEPYWMLKIGGFDGSREQARGLVREKLIDAVEKRLVADVEVGAFLSGGVDSSLIVSILAKRLGKAPKTFTIGFSEASYDERSFARLVADDCGTAHYERCLDSWDQDQLESLVLDHIGQPFADSSILPTAMVSELAAEHVKVALSGDGGDELFSGYQRYQGRALLRWYTRLPRALRGGVERIIRATPEPMAHHSRSLLKKAHLFQDVVNRQASETPYVGPLMYSKQDLAGLVPDLVDRGHSPPAMPHETRLDDIEAMMAMDAVVYLPQDILTKVDRASMAYSLEARAPFLDSQLVELAFSLPRHWHRRGFSGKRMLRESFSDLLPGRVWRRRKQGFGVPVNRWFRGRLGAELERLVEQAQSPLQKSFIHSLLTAHRQRFRDHGYRLWAIYIYLLWRQQRHPRAS